MESFFGVAKVGGSGRPVEGSWQEEGEEGSKPDENSVFETTRNTWTTQGGGMGLYCLQAGLKVHRARKSWKRGSESSRRLIFAKHAPAWTFKGGCRPGWWVGVGWGVPESTPAPPPQASKYRAYAGLGKEQRSGAADTRA